MLESKEKLKFTDQIGIHEIFDRHATTQPDAVAVVWQKKVITYAELNQFANHAANKLIELGVKSTSFIPILLPRSFELIVSLLAVLKVGAAYALLDTNWPDERLSDVIQILNPPLIITKTTLMVKHSLPIWSPEEYMSLPSPCNFSSAKITRDSLACVFFTSGTTGKPKGVLSPHLATLRLFQEKTFACFSSKTIIPLAASLPWDAFSLELWGALLNGGTSWIIDEPYLSASVLQYGISQHKINTIWMTSSLFNMVVEEDLNAFQGLQQIMIGGERLSTSHVKQFLLKHINIALINGYGPVESTVFATTHLINLEDCLRLDGIPIGKPVPNTQIYVLKESKLCDDKEIGEICIAGDGLALGYLNDPLLTAEKFVDIKINALETKIYRTGDLGYWDDGLLYFKGRLDRQLKIRGHRVELAEVENQIEKMIPAIQSCRVVAHRDPSGNVHELSAFCIPKEKGDPLDGLTRILQSKLVSYQSPSAVVAVEKFPLTSQGKLDEQALLNMLAKDINKKKTYGASEAPIKYKNPLTSLLTQIFTSVVNQLYIPPDVPFLELGGSSLDMGRISARLTAELGFVIPLSWLYRYSTINSLAAYIAEKMEAKNSINIPIVATTTEKLIEIPLSSMQLVYLTRHLVNPSDNTSLCLLTWVVEGSLDLKNLELAIDYVHNRHEPLRAAYVSDPKPTMALIDVPAPPLEILPNESSVDEAISEIRSSFSDGLDPTQGDIWRIAIVSINSESFVLGCVVHHIAFDGWSEAVFANELSTGYNNACKNQTKLTTSLPPSLFEAYVVRSSFSESLDKNTHNSFLISELQDTPELVWPQMSTQELARIPNDASKDENIEENCKEILVLINGELITTIDNLAKALNVSRFEILFAHWAQALASITKQGDFCVGVPVRQRFTENLECVLGCYINMICIRMRGRALEGNLESIVETSRVVRGALSVQDLPLDHVLQVIGKKLSRRTPLFQTLFALQNNPIPTLSFDGLKTQFIRQPYLDLPLELHAEIWPTDDNTLKLTISYRTKCVSANTVEDLARCFINRLESYKHNHMKFSERIDIPVLN